MRVQRIRGKRGLDDGAEPEGRRAGRAIVTAEDFDALLMPGGTSPDRIRTNKDVQRFVREFDTAKKPMFSIGHGAQILISAQFVRGRQLTGAHSIADDIRNAGGLYRDQPTVTDSNWVSTRGGDDMPQFNRAMLEKLATADAAATRLDRIVAGQRFAILAQREERDRDAERDLRAVDAQRREREGDRAGRARQSPT